jgi:hypothetical protein
MKLYTIANFSLVYCPCPTLSSRISDIWVCDEPIKGLRTKVHNDAVGLSVLAKSFQSILSTNTRIFGASPRGGRVVSVMIINPNQTDVHQMRNTVRSRNLPGPN